MSALEIDPRHRPLRGVLAIAAYLGGQNERLTQRQIHAGLIDATRVGKMFISTPARIDNSPLITGEPITRA
jgi:hypothetical protein